MNSKKLNSTIWRINGVIIAVLGIFLILTIIVSGIIFVSQYKNKPIKNVISTKTVITEKSISMSEPEYIKGTRSILLTLSSFENVTVPHDNSYTPVLSSSVRNYLFIDSQSRQQHWLLPTNENVILHRELIFRESHLISKTDSEIAKPNAIAQLYVLTKEDTNNDDLINELDLATLALSTADGKDFSTAIRHIEQYIGSVIIDPHYLLVFYRKSDLFYSSMIDLENFTVVSKQQISLPSMTLALRQGV